MLAPLIMCVAMFGQATNSTFTGTWQGSIRVEQSSYDVITVTIDNDGKLTGSYDFTVKNENDWEKGEVKQSRVGKNGTFLILLHYPGQEKSWAEFRGKFVLSQDEKTLNLVDCTYARPHRPDNVRSPASGSFQKLSAASVRLPLFLLPFFCHNLLMPELPEVETIKRSLNKAIIGQTINDIEIRDHKLFRGKRHDILGAKIEEIERRAKMLIWKLSNGKYLLFHLKMTGQMLYDSEDHKLIAGGGHPDSVYLKQPPHEFTHVIFTLDKGHIYFNDLRKFGWIKVLDEEGLKQEVSKLGPEIDWPEFTFEYFVKALNRKARTKVKSVLMEQSLIAGIGNIYSDETLFMAKILPTRLVKDLSEHELRSIYDSIKPVLELAIKHGGTSLKDYRRLDGSQGDYLHFANVYHRNGEPCKVCDTKIERTIVNGRSAHFCPNCQK